MPCLLRMRQLAEPRIPLDRAVAVLVGEIEQPPHAIERHLAHRRAFEEIHELRLRQPMSAVSPTCRQTVAACLPVNASELAALAVPR